VISSLVAEGSRKISAMSLPDNLSNEIEMHRSGKFSQAQLLYFYFQQLQSRYLKILEAVNYENLTIRILQA
jgi:hypothetical protein